MEMRMSGDARGAAGWTGARRQGLLDEGMSGLRNSFSFIFFVFLLCVTEQAWARLRSLTIVAKMVASCG